MFIHSPVGRNNWKMVKQTPTTRTAIFLGKAIRVV